MSEIKSIASLFLAVLLLFCSSCAPADSNLARQAAPPAGEVAQSILNACGLESGGLQRLDDQLDSDSLRAYLSNYYGLEEGSWEDCAIYLSSSAAEALEISVFRLTSQADPDEVLAHLEAYRLSRQGDFAGYNPEQAAIVENGRCVLSSGGSYAAVLICEDSGAAQSAFYDALSQDAPAASSSFPTTDPSVYAGRVPYTDPDIDDMSLYDTSAILTAWQSGSTASLSSYDLAIYQRASAVLGQILTGSMDDYEKEYAIYDWLVSHVSYDYDHYSLFSQVSRDSYTPYNPLMEGKGVCLGFASTFQLLMDMAGVECITVVGASFDSREDHAWNMVRLNGNWYCVDATWDTGSPSEYWSYFNVTSNYMAETDHQWDYASVPEATATDGGRG